MFSVGFGSENRENEIRSIAEDDSTTAVILAAVHFEWMLKRAILKLGMTPTNVLREQLEDVYTIQDKGSREGYKTIWGREVEPRFKNAALGTVLGRLPKIKTKAFKVRGQVVHGNGTVSESGAREAIDLFLEAGKKLRDFVALKGEDLDSRLAMRIKPRKSK